MVIMWEYLIGGGGLLAITVFVLCIHWRVSDMSKVIDKKVPFNRFDEYKDHINEELKSRQKDHDEKYVANQVCIVQHQNLSEKVDKMDGKLDRLLEKNGA